MASDRSDLPPLLRLLLDLADPNNNELLTRFHEDPNAVMQEYGLTEGEQALVLSGDLEAIREAIDAAFLFSGAQPPSAEDTYALVVTWAPPKPRSVRRIGVWG